LNTLTNPISTRKRDGIGERGPRDLNCQIPSAPGRVCPGELQPALDQVDRRGRGAPGHGTSAPRREVDYGSGSCSSRCVEISDQNLPRSHQTRIRAFRGSQSDRPQPPGAAPPYSPLSSPQWRVGPRNTSTYISMTCDSATAAAATRRAHTVETCTPTIDTLRNAARLQFGMISARKGYPAN